MEKYESKQVQIKRPASVIYTTLSDFTNFSPLLKDRVEDWEATPDACSFTVKGFTVKLKIEEKIENDFIKITGEDGSPFDFIFWIQMLEVGEQDTRLRLVLHIKLNMMMKMMVGSKIRSGIDQAADQIAYAFNTASLDPDILQKIKDMNVG